MYYCAQCHQVIDPMAYAALTKSVNNIGDLVICPTKGCNSPLADIDENFIPLIHTLYEFGVNTMYCCSGHYWELPTNTVDMYLLYDYENEFNDYGFVEEFTNQLIQMSKEDEYSFLNVEFIKQPEEHPVREYLNIVGMDFSTSTLVKVNTTMDKCSPDTTPLEDHLTLIVRQLEFISAINDAIYRTVHALNDEVKTWKAENIDDMTKAINDAKE